MHEQYFIGIEIGGTKLQLVSADLSFAVKEQLSFQVDKQHGAEGIRMQIEQGLKAITYGKKAVAIGVGFGGPVDYKTGKIIVSHQINGWDGFDLRQWLQHLSDAPVYIDNDANVAALGEAVMGAGATYEMVFYMTIGSGIGGGMVRNKKLYHGAYPGEVEIGHLRLDKSGVTLESISSGWAVDEQVRSAVGKDPQGLLAQLVGDASKGEAIFMQEALTRNDHIANLIMEETTDNIAFALSHVVHLLHPEIIILGGGLSLLGEYLRTPVAAALPKYLMQAFLPGPRIKLASLGEKAVPLGALLLASQGLGVGS